ncbi:MAG: hypothetical protein Q8L23_17695 [Caulobacter sp.]|nr:hypothetical protein [Caulobacter sp.]
MHRVLLSLLFGLIACGPASAQALLHSDAPLFNGADQTWPEYFFQGGSFGCKSLVPFGYWKETEVFGPDAEPSDEPDVEWVRIRNYGVFHCAYMVDRAYGEPRDWGELENAWLVLLGETEGSTGKLILYALQLGFRPGSSYTLLAAEPSKEPVRRFLVLDPVCPRGWKRGSGPIDIWRTDYCSVPDKAGLKRLAVAAARRKPLATLEYVGPAPEVGR